MSDPVLHAMLCPDDMMPSNARSVLKQALAADWEAHATVAIGPPDDEAFAVMSVMVWCRRPGARLRARWECPADRSKPFSFSSAWKNPGLYGIAERLGYGEIANALKA